MTKQEYTAEENAASISEAASIINRAMHGSYITLMDVTKAEMEYIHRAFNVMNDRIASLEAEVAQLQADNRSLVEQMALMMEHKSETVQRSQGSSTIKAIYGLEAVKYKDDVFSWVETMFEKEKKAKDALMKSDIMLVDKAGFLALCNLMLKLNQQSSKDADESDGDEDRT